MSLNAFLLILYCRYATDNERKEILFTQQCRLRSMYRLTSIVTLSGSKNYE